MKDPWVGSSRIKPYVARPVISLLCPGVLGQILDVSPSPFLNRHKAESCLVVYCPSRPPCSRTLQRQRAVSRSSSSGAARPPRAQRPRSVARILPTVPLLPGLPPDCRPPAAQQKVTDIGHAANSELNGDRSAQLSFQHTGALRQRNKIVEHGRK